MSTYKIIPLEWVTEYTPTNRRPKIVAETIIGQYWIVYRKNLFHCYCTDEETWLIATAVFEDEAKELAQNNYVSFLEDALIKI